YLKAHHPTAFLQGLLNAWPMGFYHPATLLKDAQRHGVLVRPVDADTSGWRCRWEERDPEEVKAGKPAGAVRLGLRFVRGLRKGAGLAIEEERAKAPFASPEDLVRRCDLRAGELEILANVGALASFGLSRRAALWQVARLARSAGPLFDELPDPEP